MISVEPIMSTYTLSLKWKCVSIISVGTKKRGEFVDFLLTVNTKPYIFMVVWFSLLSLKSLVFDLNIDVQLKNLGVVDSKCCQEHITIFKPE